MYDMFMCIHIEGTRSGLTDPEEMTVYLCTLSDPTKKTNYLGLL